MDKFFKIKERKSSIRIEIFGGLTTFFAMAYILFVNPNYLSQTGMPHSAVFLATCIGSAIGCLLTAFMANLPFAQAPGMGLNAFFTFTVCFTMGYTWQQALTIVLFSGILFLIFAITPLSRIIFKAIPASLKAAISAGIGLFIAIIGMINSGTGIIFLDGTNNILGLNFKLEAGFNMNALLTIIGLAITIGLIVWKVKGAIFIGIIVTTIIGIPLGVTHIPESIVNTDYSQMADCLFQFDFMGVFGQGVLPLITAIISFFIVDMFDTMGTLIGTASGANMLDKDGTLPNGNKALISDAIATIVGACCGTSTVTTYVESSAGVSEGARTGLSSVVVGILFLIAIVFFPIAGIIPGAATAPALIIVGVLMLRSTALIDWSDFEIAIPCFFTIAMMPFAYSISDGIAFGFISYTLIKMVRGKFKEVPITMYLITLIFAVTFVFKYIL